MLQQGNRVISWHPERSNLAVVGLRHGGHCGHKHGYGKAVVIKYDNGVWDWYGRMKALTFEKMAAGTHFGQGAPLGAGSGGTDSSIALTGATFTPMQYKYRRFSGGIATMVCSVLTDGMLYPKYCRAKQGLPASPRCCARRRDPDRLGNDFT